MTKKEEQNKAAVIYVSVELLLSSGACAILLSHQAPYCGGGSCLCLMVSKGGSVELSDLVSLFKAAS